MFYLTVSKKARKLKYEFNSSVQIFRGVFRPQSLCNGLHLVASVCSCFFNLMGVFRISVHAKGLGERGGGLLFSKGRKAM